MTFNPVASQMIASVGYDADLSIIAVRFHGGNTVVHGNVSRDEYVSFMGADSKGRHYNAAIAAKPKLSVSNKIDTPSEVQTPLPAGQHLDLREPVPLAPLETFAEDDCCSRRLQLAKREGVDEWSCPKCGASWRRQKLPNGMSHWAPFADFFFVKPGR